MVLEFYLLLLNVIAKRKGKSSTLLSQQGINEQFEPKFFYISGAPISFKPTVTFTKK